MKYSVLAKCGIDQLCKTLWSDISKCAKVMCKLASAKCYKNIEF